MKIKNSYKCVFGYKPSQVTLWEKQSTRKVGILF